MVPAQRFIACEHIFDRSLESHVLNWVSEAQWSRRIAQVYRPAVTVEHVLNEWPVEDWGVRPEFDFIGLQIRAQKTLNPDFQLLSDISMAHCLLATLHQRQDSIQSEITAKEKLCVGVFCVKFSTILSDTADRNQRWRLRIQWLLKMREFGIEKDVDHNVEALNKISGIIPLKQIFVNIINKL